MITVYYNGKPYQYADSTKYLELARTLQPEEFLNEDQKGEK